MTPSTLIRVTATCRAGERWTLPPCAGGRTWLFVHTLDGTETHMTDITLAELEARKDIPGWHEAWDGEQGLLG